MTVFSWCNQIQQKTENAFAKEYFRAATKLKEVAQ